MNCGRLYPNRRDCQPRNRIQGTSRRTAAQEPHSSLVIGLPCAGLESVSLVWGHRRLFGAGSSGVAPAGARRMVATPAAEQVAMIWATSS